MDDTWSAGYAGLYRHPGMAVQQFDDVTIGYDNNADGDILDAGDDIQVSDNFNSNVMSLTYDNNGNLTDDGVLRYVYDGWNRLVKVQRVAAGDATTVTEYRYLPDNRRARKVVSHSGVEAVANDGGDTTVHFYYGGVPWAAGGVSRWNICETRNGSEQVTRQWVWGTQYVDEPVFMDVNLDPATDDDCDPDTTGTGEDGETHDRRYFYVQDRNWNVVALVESDDGVGVQGRIAERYSYTPYGEFVVLKGQTGSGNLGNVLRWPPSGNRMLGRSNQVTEVGVPSWLPGHSLRFSSDRRLQAPAEPPSPPQGPPTPAGGPTQAVLCCHWFSSSGSPLGQHCQIRIITHTADGKCMATDYEGENRLPPLWPWGGSPCVSAPTTYEVPCADLCSTLDREIVKGGGNKQIGQPVDVPDTTSACLAKATGCGKEYDPLGSNSNALLALMMKCCGVPAGSGGITFPPTAPGWTGPYHGGALGGPGPIGGDPQMPCVDMFFPLFCTKCAKCSDFGL